MCMHACRHGYGDMAERDLQEQERLLQQIFRLLRCGRGEEAAEFAARSGAAWLSASIAGAGQGLLPFTVVSPVAVPRPDSLEASTGDGALAADVLSGQGVDVAAAYCTHPTARRKAWREACGAVAQAAKRHASNGSAPLGAISRSEAAVYGTLAGSVGDVLPMCGSWVDRVWAHARCLLQICPEALLEHRVKGGGGGRKQSRDVLMLFGLSPPAAAPGMPMSAREAACSFLVRCHSCSVSWEEHV
jgi:hypothetical protein